MALSEQFRCPMSGDNCEYADLCGAQKLILESGGPRRGSDLANIHARLPSDVASVELGTYCVDEQEEELKRLAQSSDDDVIRRLANMRAGQIAMSKGFHGA